MFCSQGLFTVSVHRVCLQVLFTGSVDSLFTGSDHRVCLKVFSQVLFTGFFDRVSSQSSVPTPSWAQQPQPPALHNN